MTRKTADEAARLRMRAGVLLRELRKNVGLSQSELAIMTGLHSGATVSQIECGGSRIAPDFLRAYADALEVDAREFTKRMLRFYDPVHYSILFGEAG